MKKYILNIHSRILTAAMVVLIGLSSCSDFLEVDPTNEIGKITNVSEAQAALVGSYSRLVSNRYYGTDIITYGEVRGDDMVTTKVGDRTASSYTFGNLTSLNYTNVGYFWVYIYDEIHRVNSLLTLIEDGVVVTKNKDEEAQLNSIKGQLLTLRALAHFELVKIHALPYTKDKASLGVVIADHVIAVGELIPRSTVEETYNFIVGDLNNVVTNKMIPEKINHGYINLWATKALLARVYLYMGKNAEAYTLAKEVIEKGPYSLIPNKDYLASWSDSQTSESIFEIVTDDVTNADREGIGYLMKPTNAILPTAEAGYGAVSLSPDFINLMNEDANDVRRGLMQKGNTGEQGFLAKYPGRGNIYVNNTRVIRLSDIYLIAAEAGVKSSQTDASKYLNAIRKRANPALTDVPADLATVAKERRKELVGEGHRYHDILRNLGANDKVVRSGHEAYPLTGARMPVLQWGADDSFRMIMPIPSSETDVNSVLKAQQNPGYPN